MQMLVRAKRDLADPARRGKPENCLPLACFARASPIADMVCTRMICARMIMFAHRLDVSARGCATCLNVRPVWPQDGRHLRRLRFRGEGFHENNRSISS
jgi:hypothetical protein